MLTAVAESYVKVALAVGQHDADFVDAYYGPAEWKTEVEPGPITLPEIEHRANLACHDGYSGHHVYNVLLEQQFVRARRSLPFVRSGWCGWDSDSW